MLIFSNTRELIAYVEKNDIVRTYYATDCFQIDIFKSPNFTSKVIIGKYTSQERCREVLKIIYTKLLKNEPSFIMPSE